MMTVCERGHDLSIGGVYAQNSCKTCVNLRGKEYRKTHPDEVRQAWLKHRYGMNLKEYNTLFVRQNGLCAGCLKHQVNFSRRLAVDEDPQFKGTETPRIRGLLCNACNRGLGYCKDSPLVLRRLADYLEKWGK